MRALALAVALASLGYAGVGHAQQRPVWRSSLPGDEEARDALRLRSPEARELAATASDFLLTLGIVSTAAVDALALPLARDEAHFAWQASSTYTLALATTLFLGEITKDVSRRARPYERACLMDPAPAACRAPDTFASFYSLHAAVAFTSAGTSCALGARQPADAAVAAVACATSVVIAAVTGTLRMAADRHYLSDVLVGAVLGLAVGLALPFVLVDDRGERALAP